MPPRQVWMFQFGCWAALAAAVLFVGLAVVARAHETAMIGLLFAICLASVGSMGVIVAKRGQPDPLLIYGIARSAAVVSVTLLGLSLMYFSILPSMFIAAVTTCFGVSAVKAPGV